MQYRRIGSAGTKVSVLSFGNWLTGHNPDAESVQIDCMKKSIEAGVNFIDTAEIYGAGQAEKIVGAALKALEKDRDDLVISTKFKRCGDGPNNGGLSRKHLVQGMRNSLNRLGLDYVDIMFLHRHDHETPLLETIRTVNNLIDQGKALYWGTSEFTAQQIMVCHRICEKYGFVAPTVEQPQYSMVWREKFEVEYGPLYNFGMGTTIWSPLGMGLLTGKYNDGSIPEGSRFFDMENKIIKGLLYDRLFCEEKREQTLSMLQGLGTLAGELDCTQSQLALAWAIKNPDVSTAIFGASRVEQVDDNLKAV